MDGKFFDSLAEGDSVEGVKLGMGLTCGDFWALGDGCRILYRGDGPFAIDAGRFLAVYDIDESVFSVPALVDHDNGARYYYFAGSVDGCGHEDIGNQSFLRVEFGSDGEIAEFAGWPFDIIVCEVDGGVEIVWHYCPLDWPECVGFNVYSNDGSGAVDETEPIGYISYTGKGFYCFEIDSLSSGRYVFCVKAVFADGVESECGCLAGVEIIDQPVMTVNLSGQAV